jgi:hypothetical protein
MNSRLNLRFEPVLTVTLENRGKCVSKGMPRHLLLDAQVSGHRLGRFHGRAGTASTNRFQSGSSLMTAWFRPSPGIRTDSPAIVPSQLWRNRIN